ncbi:hypothetical protein RRF57_013141 [Xylaria bambusicola]|uniref:Uncharacterized protein n=1 Tax=Xylaria bambusicola TaxID=326684 RepID=A0AAN7V6A4_9PEZI
MLRPLLPRCASALRVSTAAATRFTHSPYALSTSTSVSRWYSIQPEAASAAKQLDVDPSKLTIQKTTDPKTLVDPNTLVFGRHFTGSSSSALLPSAYEPTG